MTLTLFVPGIPAPQGSKRHVGNGVLIESSRAVGPWRERVALAAYDEHAGRPLIDAAVAVSLRFVLPRIKSTPVNPPPAAKRPDVDKLARAVLDALTAVVFRDDSQVVDLHATKRIAFRDETPGVLIEIQENP